MKVLAVEEDPLSALLLHEVLERQGHQATIVRDSEAAWAQLNLKKGEEDTSRTPAPTHYDVLITRWNAPKVSGLDTVRRIRHPDIGIPGLAVLMAMDIDTPQNRQRAEEAGVAACIGYPLDANELGKTLQSLSAPFPAPAPSPTQGNPPHFATAPSAAPGTDLALFPHELEPFRPAPPPAVVPPADILRPPSSEVMETPPSTMRTTNGHSERAFSSPTESDDRHALVPLPTSHTLGAKERLGEILVTKGLITVSQLHEALEVQNLTRERLGTILISKGWVTERDIAQAHSRQVDMTFVNVDSELVYEPMLSAIPREQALALQVLALEPAEEDLYLSNPPIRAAVANPWNTPAIDLIQVRCKRIVRPVLAETNALIRAIELAYSTSDHTYEKRQIARSLEESLHSLTEEAGQGGAPRRTIDDENIVDLDNTDDAPIIRFVNTLVLEAVRRRASDIHIEPYKNDFEVRYRIDGHLHVMQTLAKSVLPALVSRIKVQGDMDIAERRMPQDGRMNLRIDGRQVQFRISTLPVLYGERVVLRVLDGGATKKTIDQLDFSQPNLDAFNRLIQRPHGIILVTGPTGSGKTTTLYSALNAVKSSSTNVMTCEDPVEYEMDRISQSNVNPKAGLTFASQLRAILRQDPDVVLVGEIRDGETAEIAFKAALTGHLVLSTLHCNQAAGAPNRLIDMGIEPYLIASALIGVQAQRLVRRLCTECRTMGPTTADQQRILDAMYGAHLAVPAIGQPGGCPRCMNLGTAGRIGVHEIMVMSEPIQQLVIKRAVTSLVQTTAIQEGMIPMIGDGLGKIIAGLALLEDVQKKVLTD